MRQFKHQTVLVTGAAAGIGRGLCLALCHHGAWVYAADIQEDKLEELEAAATGPGSITPVALDVSNAGQFEETFARILEDHETLDLVINNAGIVVGGDFRDTGLDEIERITEINYWGVIYGCKFFLPYLKQAGEGHIVNISSIAAGGKAREDGGYVLAGQLPDAENNQPGGLVNGAYGPAWYNTIGNLAAAQIWQTYCLYDPDHEQTLQQGKLDKIKNWLTENIYRHGAFHPPSELLFNVCKEPLNSKYFIDYLKTKPEFSL